MRRQPVAFALLDAAFLADTKWRALGRRLPDPTAFNSAIGAWIRVLTAARRNGLPNVDAAEEAEDPTYIPDLIAVGLLTETGIPEKPYRAWAPARPRYPSDLAPSTPSTPSTPNVPTAPFGVPTSVSTPFTSLQLISTENGEREAVSSGEGGILAWLTQHGCHIREGNGYHQKIVLALERHDSSAFLAMLDRLSAAGVRNGDVKGLLYGAIDALDSASRPSLGAIVRDDRETEQAKAKASRWAKSAEKLAEYRRMIEPEAKA